MTDTRMVRLDQIAVGKHGIQEAWLSMASERRALQGEAPTVFVRQIGDATGGDVFEPLTDWDEAILDGIIRAKWPHLVQVEVVNG
mgnify:CR=1 FL=1